MTTPSQTDDAARIAARYPTHRGRRTEWITLAVVLSILLGSWLVWAGVHGANPDVSAQVHGVRVLGEKQIEATIRVQRPDPSRPATCTLLADDEAHRRVGEVVTVVPAAAEKIVDHVVVITTLNRATTVTIASCTIG